MQIDDVIEKKSKRSRIRGQWILVPILLLLSMAIGVGIAISTSSSDPNRPGLSVPTESLDFGAVWIQEEFEWMIPVKNVTENVIHVHDLLSSCECTSVHPTSFVLSAGETREIRMELDLMPGSVKGASLAERDFGVFLNASYTSHKDRVPRQTRWHISGKVRSSLKISPYSVDMTLVRGESSATTTVEVACHTPLRDLRAECINSMASVCLKKFAGDSAPFQLLIKPSQLLPTGPFSFVVRLTPIDEHGDTLPDVPVMVSGQVVEDVGVRPVAIQFGAKALGNTFEQTVVLYSRTGKSFRVTEVELYEQDGVKVAQLPSSSIEDLHHFRVSQHVAELGSHSSSVCFFVVQNDEADPVKISLPVAYHGLAANENPELSK